MNPTRDIWPLSAKARGPLLVFAALLVGCAGCVDTPVDPTDRYRGPVAPCDVVYDGSHEPYDDIGLASDRANPYESDPPRFWLPGPYPTWNTTPAMECADDPTIDYVATETVEKNDGTIEEIEHRDMRMYITYPAASVPTVTGDGRVAEDEFPVIIFAHANNDRVCNIYRGYYNLHEHWASWGFVVVSLDGTKLNCKRGTKQNIELRSDSQLAAIEALRDLNEDEESRFFGRLDMDRVLFAGHSRGGGASLVSQSRYPDSLGILDFQGVDITAFGFGKAPIEDVPVIGFTAGEDVDLNYPHVEPTEDQLSGEYTWINVNGGTHAYTADGAPDEPDDKPLISRKQQHNVQEYFSTAFLARVVGVPPAYGEPHEKLAGADDVLFTHYGSAVSLDEISPLGVFHRWRSSASALWVDDFDSPIAGNPESENLLGGTNSWRGFDRSEEVATYKPDDNPRSGAYSKAYSLLLVGDGTYSTELMGEDVSSFDHLVFRVKGPDDGEPSTLRVRLDDSESRSITSYRSPIPLENRMDQVVIPLNDFDVDLSAVQTLELEASGGSIFVDDLRFAQAP